MTQIAMKFVQWDVPELEKLKDSKVYKLRERLDNGDKLSREEELAHPQCEKSAAISKEVSL